MPLKAVKFRLDPVLFLDPVDDSIKAYPNIGDLWTTNFKHFINQSMYHSILKKYNYFEEVWKKLAILLDIK